MKRLLPVALALLFAACASESPSTPAKPAAAAAYANPDESARLRNEARANFERLRQQHNPQSPLPAVGEGPQVVKSEPSRTVLVAQSVPSSAPRRHWSLAEARYALQIGKSPADLTPGERAVARGE